MQAFFPFFIHIKMCSKKRAFYSALFKCLFFREGIGYVADKALALLDDILSLRLVDTKLRVQLVGDLILVAAAHNDLGDLADIIHAETHF